MNSRQIKGVLLLLFIVIFPISLVKAEERKPCIFENTPLHSVVCNEDSEPTPLTTTTTTSTTISTTSNNTTTTTKTAESSDTTQGTLAVTR